MIDKTSAHWPFFLSPHALDRVLSRSLRSPTWLLEALNEKRYAHLQYGKLTRRRYALIFDPIGEGFFVAILAIEKPLVITVLTLAQYENQYENEEGAVPLTLLQLAKMAYVNSLMPHEAEPRNVSSSAKLVQAAPVSYPEVESLLAAAGDDGAWKAHWRVVVKLKPGFSSKKILKLRIEKSTRHPWIASMLGREQSQLTQSVAFSTLSLFSVERQAHLLAKNPEFHAWLARTIDYHRQNLDDVIDVEIRSSQPTNTIIKVRDIMRESLSK
jgi:hypothetical protein